MLFVHLFDIRLFGFVCFLFFLVSGKVCGLWKNKKKKKKIKRDDFDFYIINFPFLDGDVLRRTSYGIYTSELIRFARASSTLSDFNYRNKALTAKLLRQGYRYFKIRKAFSKFYRRHSALVEKYNVSLKTLLQQGISEPECYGELVYKFRKIVGKSNFSKQIRKFINRYKWIGYSLDIMRRTACLVVNPIIDDGFASLFNCMTAVRASDSITPLQKGTRQFIDKTTHRHGFWRQFTDTIEDNSSTLFEDNSPTHYYVEIIPKQIKWRQCFENKMIYYHVYDQNNEFRILIQYFLAYWWQLRDHFNRIGWLA